MSAVDIKLRDSNSNFRNFGDVLDDVAGKWSSYSNVEQHAIATAFAGTRQQEKFLVLMQNYGTALKYADLAENSSGSAMSKFSSYEEGLEAKTNRLKASFEGLATALLNSDTVGLIVDIANHIVNAATAFNAFPIKAAGAVVFFVSMKTALVALQKSALGMNFTKLFSSITSIPMMFSQMGTALSLIGTEGTASISSLSIALTGLSKEQQVNLLVQNQQLLGQYALDEAYVQGILVRAGMTEEEATATAAQVVSTAATVADIAAKEADTVATFSLVAAAKGLGAVMAANPFGAFLVIVGLIAAAVYGVKKAIDATTTSFEEHQTKLSGLKSDLTSLTDELNTTKDKIAELSSQDSLTLTDADQLKELKATNTELERKISLLKEQKDVEQATVAKGVSDQFNKDYGSSGTLTAISTDTDTSKRDALVDEQKKLQSAIDDTTASYKDRNSAIQKYNDLQKQIDNIDYANGFDSTISKSVDIGTWIDQAIKRYQELNKKRYDGIALTDAESTELASLRTQMVGLATDLDSRVEQYGIDDATSKSWHNFSVEISNTLNGASAQFDTVLSKFPEVKMQLEALGLQGKVTSEMLSTGAFSKFVNALIQSGVIANSSSDELQKVANSLNDVSSSADSAASSTEDSYTTWSDNLNALETSAKSLTSAYESLSKGEALSTDQIFALITQYPDLLQYMDTENGTLNITTSLLEAKFDQIKKTKIEALSASKAEAEANLTLAKSALESASAHALMYASMADVRDKTSGTIVGSLSTGSPLINSQNPYANTINSSQSQITSLLAQVKNLTAEINAFDGVTLKDITSGSSTTDKYTQSLDKLYDSKKRLTEITDEQATVQAKLDLLDDNDYSGKIADNQKLADLYSQQNDALHDQNEQIRSIIKQDISKLGSYGIGVNYDAASNSVLVKNAEHIQELFNSGAINSTQAKALEDIVSEVEDMNSTAVTNSNTYLENVGKIKADYAEIEKINEDIYQAQQDATNSQLDLLKSKYSHEESVGDTSSLNDNLKKQLADQLSLQEAAHAEAERLRALGYSENSDEIKATVSTWWSAQSEIDSINQTMTSNALDGLKEIQDAQKSLLDLTISMIKQEQETKKTALEDEKTSYDDIISLKEKSLELTKSENDYNEKISSEVSSISKLQATADALALDDSRSAQTERASILEQISEAQTTLADDQASQSVDDQKSALEDAQSNYDDALDTQISSIEDFLDNQVELTQAAYDRIDSDGDGLYSELLTYSQTYTDTSESDLVSMWTTAMTEAEKYSSFVESMQAVNSEVTASGGDSTQVTSDSASSNSSSSSSIVSSIVDEMKANSSAWKTATSDTVKGNLASANETLKDKLASNGVNAIKGSDGVWYIDYVGGKKLYETYHTGGIAGDGSNLEQNELFAKLLKGELILNNDQQAKVNAQIQSAASQISVLSSIAGLSSSLLGSVTNSTSSKAVNYTANFTINGYADDQIIQAIDDNQRKVANIIADALT